MLTRSTVQLNSHNMLSAEAERQKQMLMDTGTHSVYLLLMSPIKYNSSLVNKQGIGQGKKFSIYWLDCMVRLLVKWGWHVCVIILHSVPHIVPHFSHLCCLFSQGSKSSLEGSRPVGQVDKHILLLVHGVGNAGKSWELKWWIMILKC